MLKPIFFTLFLIIQFYQIGFSVDITWAKFFNHIDNGSAFCRFRNFGFFLLLLLSLLHKVNIKSSGKIYEVFKTS